jgi:hypothetical protein
MGPFTGSQWGALAVAAIALALLVALRNGPVVSAAEDVARGAVLEVPPVEEPATAAIEDEA